MAICRRLLHVRSTALCSALPAKQRFAANVIQGRVNLSSRDVKDIAASLEISTEDLLRAVTVASKLKEVICPM